MTAVDEAHYKALIAQALGELKKLKAQLRERDEAALEPIAVVGIGLRIPGGPERGPATSAADFWRLLREGRDLVAEMPADRWDLEQFYNPDPDAPGKILTRSGSFLADVKGFDAEFFGIAPREAQRLDPQQRLLLEVSWEALEHASLDPHSLADSRTGVFVGVTWDDYLRLLSALPAEDLDSYALFGTTKAGAAGRLSHFYGFQGPSLAVDTACSSSLVSVHLACASLRRGESDLALAAGANLILTPQTSVSASRAHMISPDGRCKTFSAAADGFGRAEAVGVVVLQRLRDAQAAGNRVIAVIRHSAVNQDGHTSGLTVPNGLAQQRLLRACLDEAGIAPSEIGYLEAHGTGTPLGDPIELDAIDAVYGPGRQGKLLVGSAKSNLGHAEGAAGIVGLIKLALCLQHGEIPRNLHFNQPNPHIDWQHIRIEVPTAHRAWDFQAKRMGAISSFGFTGTNAHALLAERPAPTPRLNAQAGPCPLVLSARSEYALRSLAQAWSARLSDGDAPFAEFCANAALGRAHFAHRLALVHHDAEGARAQLTAFLAGARADVHLGTCWSKPKFGLVFLCTGQGAQSVGMGRELYEHEPVFRQALDQCDALLAPVLGKGLVESLYGPDASDAAMARTRLTQPALFAFEVALAQLWRAWGVSPAAVLGHSVGEFVAAWLAGVFSLEDGLRLIAARGALMDALPEGGAMLAVAAPVDDLRPLLAAHGDALAVAAINGPAHTVLSGRIEALVSVREQLAARGIEAKSLNVSHAFHSPLMAPMLEAFRAVARTVTYSPPKIEFLSNLSGQPAGAEVADAEYWVRHVLAEVRFAPSLVRLGELGYRHFLELGPKPILTALAAHTLDAERSACWPSLRGRGQDRVDLLNALCALHCHGHAIDWRGIFPAGRQPLELPSYPFQRQPFWTAPLAGTGNRPRQWPYPGKRLALPIADLTVYEADLSAQAPSFMADHKLFGQTLVAAGSHLCAALAGAPAGPLVQLEQLRFTRPLVLPKEGDVRQQLIFERTGNGHSFRLASLAADAQAEDASAWTTHVLGRVAGPAGPAPAAPDLAPLRASGQIDAATFDRYWPEGYARGPAFRWIRALHLGAGEALATLVPPDMTIEAGRYSIFPGLLDSCFQVIAACLPPGSLSVGQRLHVPAALERLGFHAPIPSGALRCYARLISHSAEAIVADLLLLDEAERVLASFEGLRTAAIEIGQADGTLADAPLYALRWRPRPAADEGAPSARSWLILGEDTPPMASLVARLVSLGHRCSLLTPAQEGQLGERLAQPWDQLIYAWGSDANAGPDRLEHALGGLLRLTQSMNFEQATNLWIVTRGGQSLDGAAPDPTAAALWGFARCLALEQPQLRLCCVDLDDDPSRDVDHLIDAFRHGQSEPQVAYRANKGLLPRLTRIAPAASTLALSATGSYLITGGLGGLGLSLAAQLVAGGARRLILTGRGAPSAAASARLTALTAAGAEVVIERVDVCDRAALTELFARHRDLRGLIHAAGLRDDGMLADQSWPRFAAVLAPKLNGTLLLDELAPAGLDFFVCCSSMAGLLGSASQSAYAAANAAMDAVVQRRRARGHAAVSLVWGPWAEVGMAAALEANLQARLEAVGIERLDPTEGCRLFEQLARCAEAVIAVLPIQWPRYLAQLPASARPLLVELVSAEPSSGLPLWPELLAAEPVHLRRGLLAAELRRAVARILGISAPEQLRDDRSLFDLGMDSLTAVELRNEVASRLGRAVKTSLVFDYPTLAELLDYLCGKHLAELIDPPAAPAAKAATPAQPPAAAAEQAPAAPSEAELEAMLLAELEQLDY